MGKVGPRDGKKWSRCRNKVVCIGEIVLKADKSPNNESFYS